MIVEIEYHQGLSFCELAKQFETTPYEIFKLNNIHNILDLYDGQKIKIEVVKNAYNSIK